MPHRTRASVYRRRDIRTGGAYIFTATSTEIRIGRSLPQQHIATINAGACDYDQLIELAEFISHIARLSRGEDVPKLPRTILSPGRTSVSRSETIRR
jgi:hypothetical protein